MKAFRLFAGYAGMLVMMLIPFHALADDGAFSGLYAARAPADASFVRVVSTSQDSVSVQIANAQIQKMTLLKPSSSYAIVKGNEQFYIRINNKRSEPLSVLPGTFNTFIVNSGDQTEPWVKIDDTRTDNNALKATIHFYNLNKDCTYGRLLVSPQGAVLIQDVPPSGWAARAVNPISAKLSAACKDLITNEIELPELRGGEHFSVFLRGAGSVPSLTGQINGVDPYKQ